MTVLQSMLLDYLQHLQFHVLIVIGFLMTAVFGVCNWLGHVWCKPNSRVDTVLYFVGTPLLAASVWAPLLFAPVWKTSNAYGLGAAASMLIRVVMFCNKVGSMKGSRGTASWAILISCWASLAFFWGVMARYSTTWPSIFLPGAPKTAMCDSLRPLQDPFWDCVWLSVFSAFMALHSLVWFATNATPATSIHQHMRVSASIDFNGYALLFFNLKQLFLWFVAWVGMSDQFPDQVMALAAYSEVLHSFKSGLLMWRVFGAMHKTAPGVTGNGASSKAIQTRVGKKTGLPALACILLSTMGGQIAYLLAELGGQSNMLTELGLGTVSFTFPLILIVVFEFAADLSILWAVRRENAGQVLPLEDANDQVEEKYGRFWSWLTNLQRRLLIWLLSTGVVLWFSLGMSLVYYNPDMPLLVVYTLGGLTCYCQVDHILH